MIPGCALHRLARLLCNQKSVQQVVEPAIADFQQEYSDAPRNIRARSRILMGGYAAVVVGIAMCVFEVSTTTDDRHALRRMFAWAIGVTGCTATALVAVVFNMFAGNGDGTPSLVFLGMLLPMALPIAIPVGLAIGLAFGFGGRPISPGARRVVVLTAVVASLVCLVTMAVVMPLANQAFRQAAFQARGGTGTVAKGPNEMSLSELRARTPLATVASPQQRELARQRAWNYHLRIALSFAAIVLTIFALAVADRAGRASRPMLMSACAVYFLLTYAAESLTFSGIPPVASAWLPNMVFIATTSFMFFHRDRVVVVL